LSKKDALPLAEQVLHTLMGGIRRGTYPPGSKLPPENHLADELGVSRSTVRQALSKLAEHDLITRKPGDGTYVTRLSGVVNPLNQFVHLFERIAEHGCEPAFFTLSVETVRADTALSKALNVRPQSDVLMVRKVFTADGKPVIYVINYVPLWVYENYVTPKELADPEFTTQPFLEFFSERCQQPVKYYISSISAEMAKSLDLPDAFSEIDPCSAVLVIDDIGYNYNERPVFYSREHFTHNFINLQVVRRVDV
jgi:GntR family transcriptional regulator